jgi:hypothetical protein
MSVEEECLESIAQAEEQFGRVTPIEAQCRRSWLEAELLFVTPQHMRQFYYLKEMRDDAIRREIAVRRAAALNAVRNYRPESLVVPDYITEETAPLWCKKLST